MRWLQLLLILQSPLLAANPYWVSPTGEASWASAQSATSLSGIACASLSTCNGNIIGGNLAYLRGGTYSNHIFPTANGTTNNFIHYAAYSGETPVINNGSVAYATYYHSLNLWAKSWVKVSGITFERNDTQGTYLLRIYAGGSFNEIDNCIFDGRFGGAVLTIWDGGSTPDPSGAACVHNWIHGCTFKTTGSVHWNGSYVDDDGGFQLGVPTYDDHSNNNTIENCTFYGGGHHNLETFTKYNVIRNNFFHNEGSITNSSGHAAQNGPDSNGLYGNRNLQIYDGNNNDGMFNLLEGNRFGTSGPPPDDDGGDGLTITAPKNIIRYNTIYNSQNNCVLFKVGSGSFSNTNRFFNNTAYFSGRWQPTPGNPIQGALLRWYGTYTNYGTIIKNNIFYYRSLGANDTTGGAASPATYGTIITNNWWTTNGNPSFISTNVSDPTSTLLPNLRLNDGSGAINIGVPLTTASGGGSASTSLTVADALYFQDGTWGSVLAGHQADRIAVGSVTNIVTISSIDYTNQIITLASPITWLDAASVWLYSRNDGTVVLSGAVPDLGAYEFGLGVDFVNQVRPRRSPIGSTRRR